MNITRRGATYNYGPRTVVLDNATASCSDAASVVLTASHVKDFTGKSHHDYTVTISAEDLVLILRCVASSAMANPVPFSQALSPVLKELVQLQLIAAGAVRAAP